MESGTVPPLARARALRVAAWGAGIAFALATIGFGASLPGYAQARDPVALLGSALAPYAQAFNLSAFALPGLAIAVFALAFERSFGGAGGGEGRLLRIATGLLLISGLAFAAQGAFPMAPDDLDGEASRRHALAWSFALLGWLASAPLLSLALVRVPGGSRLAVVGALIWILALVALVAPRAADSAGLWQRAVLAAYFLWPALLSLHARPGRGAT